MTAIEEQVRDYLRADAEVMGLLQNDPARCDVEYRGNTKATHITIFRAGGGGAEHTPVEVASVNIHCYGSTRRAAAELADAVGDALWALTSAARPLLSARTESTSYLPLADGTDRYSVVTSITRTLALAG